MIIFNIAANYTAYRAQPIVLPPTPMVLQIAEMALLMAPKMPLLMALQMAMLMALQIAPLRA